MTTDSVRCPFCKEALPPLMPPLPPMDLSRVPEGVRRKRRQARMVEVAVAQTHATAGCSVHPEDWLTTVEVAKVLGVDRGWVLYRIKRQKIAAIQNYRGHWLIHRRHVAGLRRALVLT